jgi:uncharacterized membrane protein YoaT (DUF817 family)
VEDTDIYGVGGVGYTDIYGVGGWRSGRHWFILSTLCSIYNFPGASTVGNVPLWVGSLWTIVGSICVASVKINDVTAATLLDTGFQVSIISQSFYNQHFYNREIKPLIDIDVECANIKQLRHFTACYIMFYGTLKSNINLDRWPRSILLLSVP